MAAVYVTSLRGGSGKTVVCAGLAQHLVATGKKVAYFKPVIADVKSQPAEDSDAVFFKETLALEEPEAQICPTIGDLDVSAGEIKAAYERISKGKDVVIVEGIWRQRPGGSPGEAAYQVVAALGAAVIVVVGYNEWLAEAEVTSRCQAFGDYLLGIVLNRVPQNRVKEVRDGFSVRFGRAGVVLLGVIPEDRILLAPTVGELAEYLGGQILNSVDSSGEVVENIMLGAMSLDSGLSYFGRKQKKAVMVPAGRADMQLAALPTSTRCLILSGGAEPSPTVISQADDKQIPVIQAAGDMITLVTAVEDIFSKMKFNQAKKLPRLVEIIEEHFDFAALYQGLGLDG